MAYILSLAWREIQNNFLLFKQKKKEKYAVAYKLHNFFGNPKVTYIFIWSTDQYLFNWKEAILSHLLVLKDDIYIQFISAMVRNSKWLEFLNKRQKQYCLACRLHNFFGNHQESPIFSYALDTNIYLTITTRKRKIR